MTLARSVAHLSSEMRSQHLVTQELEQLRQDLNFRMQQTQVNYPNKSNENLNDTADGPNLTNPKRVKKLTKFFGEDPPLMRLFLKKLGYEVCQSNYQKRILENFPFDFRNTRRSSKPNESEWLSCRTWAKRDCRSWACLSDHDWEYSKKRKSLSLKIRRCA